VFDHHLTGNDPYVQAYERPAPDRDRLIVVGLRGAARRHARWGHLSESETAEAMAELQELAGDRADLLAQVARLLTGFHEGELEAKALAAAQLCIEAGADQALIPRWIEEGRRRAENARRMPHSGRPRGRRS